MSAELDDVLDRATRALRKETAAPSPQAGRTRARVIASTTRSKRRRKVAMTLVPLAAVLAVSSAWADTRTRHWLAGAWEAVGRVEASFGASPSRPAAGGHRELAHAASTAETSARPAVPAAPVTPTVSIDDLPRAPPAVASSAPLAQASRSGLVASTASAAAPAVGGANSAESGEGTEDASRLYAAAHRAHFVDRDPAAALRAWDAYLLAAPSGALAPEARYNRALTLVRLGRREEAREALEAFAGGASSYRAREARDLLEAMEDAGKTP
jgi:hypothetical protein